VTGSRRKSATPEPEPEPEPEASTSSQMRMVLMVPKDTFDAVELASSKLNTTKSCVVHMAINQFIATSEALQFADKTNQFVKGEGG
jgi:hypothetical protein